MSGTILLSGTILFDSTANALVNANSLDPGSGIDAQSFSTTNSQVTLTDLQFRLLTDDLNDGGSITVTLHSDSNDAPGGVVATLGTILDSDIDSQLTDLTVTDPTVLDAGTRYWIELASTTGSHARWWYSYGTGGTGVAGESSDVNGVVSIIPNEMQVTAETACYAAGTRIRTMRGDIAVETLQAGDLAITASGQQAPIRWIGRRGVAPARHSRPWDVNPIRISAEAIGRNIPGRDLLVSPDHALLFGEVLIRARDLLNGATIVQDEVAELTYYHVELDRHDILLAEGVAAESFLDTGNRSAFDNGGAPMMLHPDFSRADLSSEAWATRACAPLVWTGEAVVATRALLAARAKMLGWSLSDQPDLHMVAGGQTLRPHHEAAALVFDLPPGSTEATLLSRSASPAQVLADTRDTRVLGVGITRLALDGRDIPLDAPIFRSGWLPAEPELRWTDGAATLDVSGAHRLSIELAGLLRYWVAPGVRQAA